ncbi:MAG: CusA/CzcA family heavy metal efflux RND transporter [Nitrospiraceae bacterium]
MLSSFVSFSLRQGILVMVLACIVVAGGVYAFLTISIDAFPDVTTILVQVVAKAPGLSPAEMERFVTFPIELQLSGSPGLVEVRSLSKVGLAMIDVIFKDSMDIYLARQVVLQRLLEARDLLPPGADPQLVPNTTGLSEVFQYYLEGPEDNVPAHKMSEMELMERRTLQDWVIRPILKSVPDVVDVNAMGGFVKQYQVIVDPEMLRKYDLALHDVFEAVAKNNANAGGNILEKNAEKYIVRGVGLIKSIEDIETIVVKQVGGTPVYVRDVADVKIGHAVRHGAAVVNGHREAVAGIVLMLRGGNAREVVEAVKHQIDEIHRDHLLPNGLRIVPFYDRLELISSALNTVYKALLEGIMLVIVVLFLFLGNVRSALVVTATLIVTPLATFIIMDQVGLTANLMSLGGLVIAIGMMVDGSVVVVENVYRLMSEHHGEKQDRMGLIVQAVKEVGQPVIFGILIIILVFLPILSLQGMEGKMFQPLAYSIMIALLVSLVVSLTLSPVLCFFALQRGSEEDTFLVRWSKRLYLPALTWALGHRTVVLLLAVTLLIASLGLFPFLGGEFIPILNEGAISPQTIRLPSISLEKSIEIEKEMQQAILEFPEVRSVVSKIGRTELGNDPQEPNSSDPVVSLKPMEEWTTAKTKPELDDAVRRRIQQVAGANFLLSQPIQQRVDELLSGVRSEATVKILGEDLTVLRHAADKIQAILASVRGVGDVRVEQLFGQAYLTIDIDRQKIARHGINVAQIREIITTAIGQEPATRVYEGQRRFDLILRYPEQYRDSVEDISNILLTTVTGALVPLGDLAKVEIREGPALISREGLHRRIYVGFNTLGRDIESIVTEAQQKISKQIKLPPGYEMKWGGSFENMQRAMARLKIIVPITIGLIFLLLFSSFNSVRYAGLIILNLPFSLIGGLVALWVTGEYLSVPASIGFINLFGVAVLNGIVLVSYINKLHEEDGLDLDDAVVKGCLLRLRPVLTTALVALLGLVPLALSHGIGSEVQRPLAVVVIGGLVSSTLLTLIVLPAVYGWFAPRPARQAVPETRNQPLHAPGMVPSVVHRADQR